MNRRRFEVYLNKIFDFSSQVSALPEGRCHPQHPGPKVFAALFFGAAAQIPSLLQIEAECRRGSLARRIGSLSNNTLAYAMQHQNPEDLFALGCTLARRIKRNALLHSSWARGHVVAAVDGIEICSSYTRCCSRCLERHVKRNVDGELRECIQYYHRLVVVAVVRGPFPVPLGLRFQQPGECEVACARLLLHELVERLGRRYFDLLVADAIYLQKPFIDEIEQLGPRWLINLKDNQPDLLAAAERLTAGPAHGTETETGQSLDFWHLP